MLSAIEDISGQSSWTIVAGIAAIYLSYNLTLAIYATYFGPLASLPGPKWRGSNRYPWLITTWKGATVTDVKAMHDKYGPIVRVGTNQVSFNTAQAWRDINGHRTAGKKSFLKDRRFYTPSINGVDGIVSAVEDDKHARMRRILSHSFSDKALKDQEPLFKHWSAKLVEKLTEANTAKPNEAVDMVKYWNCTTFDIMGDLTFAEPLYMLENGEYSPWVKIIFESIKLASRLNAIKQLPGMATVMKLFLTNRMRKAQAEHFDYSKERVDRRLAKTESRADLWTEVLKRKEKEGLSLEEMHSNGSTFMIAGTETTATLLSGLSYLLLKNPETMTKLVTEIRETFSTSEDITIEALAKMPYLNACLEEGLRMYPPVPVGLPRVVPEGGAQVTGVFIPEGTIVSVHQYSTFHSSRNFALPDEFIPERWLSGSNADERFAADDKAAFQPFSFGPRNCIGKNLAYHEARLLLSEVLWKFDFELSEQSEGWIDQKVYVLWEKVPLWIKLRAREMKA